MVPRRSHGDPATASIERFDPCELRCEVLRRFAQERVRASAAAAAAGAGAFADGVGGSMFGGGEPAVSSGATVQVATAHQTSRTTLVSDAPNAATAEDASAEKVAGTGIMEAMAAAWVFMKACFGDWVECGKVFVYLGFPKDSLFLDPCVEELYQLHQMQHWSPRIDWSAVALVQMFLWDVAANPPYRLSLVLHFYGCFAASVVLHRLLFLANRGRPRRWRTTRGILLCGFLLGRGVVCHPVLSEPPTHGDFGGAEESLQTVQAASSLIGLGMTNLSTVMGLQLHTFDTLLLCVAHNLACTCWAVLALHMPLSGSWHMVLAGQTLVACVCIWQQHEQERFDRNSFEQEMLMERGILLRSSDRIARQGTQAEFSSCMRVLYRIRCAEQLNF
eukprot:TRINITY_DN76427_c0_g1_i1.p1 TRINITY_DN76427_c0_g1~~TRINITY_DN76427_c0_g1_i1.p1  ORF type:complete len:417 (-),score=45.33 TRINITY_DN76427_c0_g1_i1:46-1215(-)